MATLLSVGDILELRGIGLLSAQAVDMQFMYRVGNIVANPTLEMVLDQWGDFFALTVLPDLSDQLDMISYEGRRLKTLLRRGVPNVPTQGVKRYDAEAEILADPLHVGGVAGAVMPSFIVATYSRVSDGVQSTEYNDDPFPANLAQSEKTFKSSIGLSGIPEVYTDAGTPNLLNAAAIAALEDVVTDMANITVSNGTSDARLDGIIVSTIREGFSRFGAAPTDTQLVFAWQTYSTATLDAVVSTRRSRKQRSTGA